jgi:hypothetical protein
MEVVMKISKLFKVATVTFAVLSAGAFSPTEESLAVRNAQDNGVAIERVDELTPAQRDSLLFMWEEEKVARDVYITLGEHYRNARIFRNIAKSEQNHMDAVANLVYRYNIPLPDVEEVGEFATPAFQELYDQLIERGLRSRTEALRVGLDIEILDIEELEERLEDANDAMTVVYENLLVASYRHKAAFERNLSR